MLFSEISARENMFPWKANTAYADVMSGLISQPANINPVFVSN